MKQRQLMAWLLWDSNLLFPSCDPRNPSPCFEQVDLLDHRAISSRSWSTKRERDRWQLLEVAFWACCGLVFFLFLVLFCFKQQKCGNQSRQNSGLAFCTVLTITSILEQKGEFHCQLWQMLQVGFTFLQIRTRCSTVISDPWKKPGVGWCAEFVSKGAGGRNQKLQRKMARNGLRKEREDLGVRLTWFWHRVWDKLLVEDTQLIEKRESCPQTSKEKKHLPALQHSSVVSNRCWNLSSPRAGLHRESIPLVLPR